MPSKLFLHDCPHHGNVKHRMRSDGGVRCCICAVRQIDDFRRKRKDKLLQEAGGACIRCGYSKCSDALEFHHREPKGKLFELSLAGMTKRPDQIAAEVAKCDLVCRNCHAEIHKSMRSANK